MSENNKTPFQLKPKHLIRTLFLASLIAATALVVDVSSTLNSGKTDVPKKSPAEQIDTRIEVQRPSGAVEPKTVQPTKDGDAKAASGNPVVPQNEKGEEAEEGVKNDRPAAHCGKRAENKCTEINKSKNTQSDNNSSATQNKPEADSQPVENKAASNKPTAQAAENRSAKAKAPESKSIPEAELEAKP